MDQLQTAGVRRAITSSPGTTVRNLCALMARERVSAVAVVEADRLVGIVSERDIVFRVVVEGRDPDTTLAGDIMTKQVQTAREDIEATDAIRLMLDGRFRHLPMVDAQGRVLGMLSVRHLLRHQVEDMKGRNRELAEYVGAESQRLLD